MWLVQNQPWSTAVLLWPALLSCPDLSSWLLQLFLCSPSAKTTQQPLLAAVLKALGLHRADFQAQLHPRPAVGAGKASNLFPHLPRDHEQDLPWRILGMTLRGGACTGQVLMAPATASQG